MFGTKLILVLAVMGGAIAFLGDKLGSKIGKKRLTIFGLRPHYTSILMTIITGILVAVVTMGLLMVSSSNVRTALFGMEKIRAEIVTLNQDKDAIAQELMLQKTKVKELDNKIRQSSQDLTKANAQKARAQAKVAELEERYERAREKLRVAEAQVQNIQAARDKLQGEVQVLENTTNKLREGIAAIREGNVVFRSGEILYAGVLKAGLPPAENQKQMDTFLALANAHVLERLGIKENKQAIWVSKTTVKDATKALATGKGEIYVRVCAAGNILADELAVSRLEMVANNRVYSANEEILRQKISVDANSQDVELALLGFLKAVNKAAVAKGVVPDPITGKVGAIDAREMEAISAAIRKMGGKAEIIARAKGEIAVSGPVLLKVDVESND